MATAKKLTDTAPQALDAPVTVQLRCEDLGETQDFAPEHAEALLKWQQTRGLHGKSTWQPVTNTPATTEA